MSIYRSRSAGKNEGSENRYAAVLIVMCTFQEMEGTSSFYNLSTKKINTFGGVWATLDT